MKKLLLVIPVFFMFLFSASATDYYISADGNDYNNGTSPSSAWQSLNKLNAYFANLRPGDRVLLRRGDTFYGTIKINRSGSAGAPITITAYGSGEKPVITGFTNVSSWNNLGGNIWESRDAVSGLSYTNMVSVNGVNTAMGRWPNSTGPNTGYLTIKSHSGTNSVSTDQLIGSPNWAGADIVIRKEKFNLERGKVTSQSGGTIYYKGNSYNPTIDGYGFFIQNDARTLDQNGEWYYNPYNNKLRIFYTSTPPNVKIASVENLIWISRQSYVVIDNLTLIGSNGDAISGIDYGHHLTIQNCNISFAGINGIHTKMDHTTVQNCTITQVNYSGILTVEHHSLIENNYVGDVNMFEGMEDINAASDFLAAGIYANGAYAEIINNRIEKIGYSGIILTGRNTNIKNNFVNGFGYTKEDGGGIYTGSRDLTQGSIIDGNIVINGIGAKGGCRDSMNNDIAGIFLDAYSTGITISNNTVANVASSGIKLHGATNIQVLNNTTYNNGGPGWVKGGLTLLAGNEWPLRGMRIENNIFFARNKDQVSLFAYPPKANTEDIKNFGSSDNNYFAKPIDEVTSINIYQSTFGVQGWQNYSNQDWSSNASAKKVTDLNDIRFEYNASFSSKTIQLDGNYIDVKNNSYNGSLTLAPFTSAVLLRNGGVQMDPLIAYAGDDQNITLPSNNTSLKGSWGGKGRNVSSYTWTKVSGPNEGKITNPNNESTTLTDLVEGVYTFQLKVTDQNGATATSDVKITVVSSGVLLPAKTPQNIVNGLNYNYYEGTYSMVPNFSSLSPVKSGYINNFDLSIANRQDLFAVQYTGYIEVPSDGNYTFYTTSDDGSMLYIDGVLVVNNDGLHAAEEKSGSIGLKAGKHEITVSFFEQRGDQILNVSYSSADFGKRAIPNASLYRNSAEILLPSKNPQNTVNGLDYKYYEGTFSTVPDFSKLSPVKSGAVNNFDLSIANKADLFGASFSGYIEVPSDGQYTFYTTSDDGSMLYIDGVLVVNNDGLHAAEEKSGTIGLKAGKHEIYVGYFEQRGDQVLNVGYSGGNISKRSIPNSSLYRVNSDDGLLPAVYPSNIVNGLNYNYYESTHYFQMPDFSKIKSIKSGAVSNFDISVANRTEIFAINFSGYIEVPTDGQYTFYTTSDDGSMLYIDNNLVVNNDGLHGAIERSGTIGLKAGKHLISVGFFQHQIDKSLKVNFAGPGISKSLIPSAILYRDLSINLSEGGFNGDALLSNKPLTDQSLNNSLKIGIQAFPNPFVNSVTVSINGEAGDYDLQLIDGLGRTVWFRKGTKNEGYYQQSINTSSLQKGIYFLKVIQNDKSSTIKLIK